MGEPIVFVMMSRRIALECSSGDSKIVVDPVLLVFGKHLLPRFTPSLPASLPPCLWNDR